MIRALSLINLFELFPSEIDAVVTADNDCGSCSSMEIDAADDVTYSCCSELSSTTISDCDSISDYFNLNLNSSAAIYIHRPITAAIRNMNPARN